MTDSKPSRLRFHPTRRRRQWACDLCAALVEEDGMVRHARFHADHGDLVDVHPSCARTSEWTDREVVFTDQLAEVVNA